MYNELVKMLREDLDCDYPEECKDCGAAGNCHSQLVGQAIEAIEELQNRADYYQAQADIFRGVIEEAAKNG